MALSSPVATVSITGPQLWKRVFKRNLLQHPQIQLPFSTALLNSSFHFLLNIRDGVAATHHFPKQPFPLSVVERFTPHTGPKPIFRETCLLEPVLSPDGIRELMTFCQGSLRGLPFSFSAFNFHSEKTAAKCLHRTGSLP